MSFTKVHSRLISGLSEHSGLYRLFFFYKIAYDLDKTQTWGLKTNFMTKLFPCSQIFTIETATK